MLSGALGVPNCIVTSCPTCTLYTKDPGGISQYPFVLMDFFVTSLMLSLQIELREGLSIRFMEGGKRPNRL